MIILILSAALFAATIAINMMADDEARKTRELLEELNTNHR